MPNSCWFSVCPFGTASIETGTGTIAINSGVATLSVEQTGNIGAGVCIEYNSTECFIAPNRIAFNSGGTTELLPDTKIAGGTSGATGIVRFIEVTSGTWAGGNAAGYIYFESTTGTWSSGEQINRTKPTSSTNIATTNGSFQGNIGNGSTQFVIKTATGGTPSNQSSVAVTSIHHEYASLSAFEAGFTDSLHINNTSLASADVVAHACCYYDHDNYTTDGAVTFDGTTTDATRYINCYTPVGGSESINNQRHSGVFDTQKYLIDNTGTLDGIRFTDHFGRFDGLQIYTHNANTGWALHGFYIRNYTAVGDCYIDNCIIRHVVDGGSVEGTAGIKCNSTNITLYARNNIIYGFHDAYYLDAVANAYIYYCIGANGLTVTSDSTGIHRDAGGVTSVNSAFFNNISDFDGIISCDYCASDDADASTYTNGIDWANEATDWANVFNNYAAGDFSLNNFTGTGGVIEQGTDLSSSEGIWRDIAGNERGSTPDIGAFEYVSSGTNLIIAALSSAGTLDNVSLTQKHALAVQELLSAGTVDNVILSVSVILQIAELLSSGALDNISLTQKHTLVVQQLISAGVVDNVVLSAGVALQVAEMLSSGTLDNVSLTQKHIIVMQELLSAGAIDTVNLTQKHILAIQELISVNAIDNVTLSVGIILQVAEMLSGSTIDTVSLTQKHTLVVQELISAGVVDNVTVSISTILAVAGMISAGLLDNVSLTQKHIIVVENLASACSIDDVVLIQKYILTLQDMLSSGEIDNISLSMSISLVVASLLSSASVDSVILTQKHVLLVDGLLSLAAIDNIDLIQKHILAINNMLSSGLLDNVNFNIAFGLLQIVLTTMAEYNLDLLTCCEYNLDLSTL